MYLIATWVLILVKRVTRGGRMIANWRGISWRRRWRHPTSNKNPPSREQEPLHKPKSQSVDWMSLIIYKRNKLWEMLTPIYWSVKTQQRAMSKGSTQERRPKERQILIMNPQLIHHYSLRECNNLRSQINQMRSPKLKELKLYLVQGHQLERSHQWSSKKRKIQKI